MSTLLNEIVKQADSKATITKACTAWRKMLKKNNISIMQLHMAFSERYPETLSYEGFYKGIVSGRMTPANYRRTKEIMDELTKRLSAI